MTGKVTLVGAGPGDGGLMTINGRRALESAQVVLADRLVGPGILSLIPPSAEIIQVGKESGRHPVPQQEINALILEKARAGLNVVRLKGGDPYLFGRGAEELEAVAAAGIPFGVVPGVSASLAVPSYAGIPVTHREHSSSVHILTGHAKAGHTPDIDYKSLVRLGGTLVFMMGFEALDSILDGLRAAGLSPETPAALIQEGTLPTQRKLVATAATLFQRAEEAGMAPPAVLVVGAVCALSQSLDWFSALPLSGKRVLVTRPQSADSRLADMLEALGCEAIRFPCIQLVPIPGGTLPQGLEDYHWIVFTSAFGVDMFFSLLRREGRDIRSLTGQSFAAIGSATAAALERRGVLVDYMPPVYDAAHLAEGLADNMLPGQKALLFRAGMGTRELPRILEEHGISYLDHAAYDTLYHNPAFPRIVRLLREGVVDYVTFTSASTVRGFVEAVGAEAASNRKFTALCIGQQTAAEAEAAGMTVLISPEATIDSMVSALLAHEGADDSP